MDAAALILLQTSTNNNNFNHEYLLLELVAALVPAARFNRDDSRVSWAVVPLRLGIVFLLARLELDEFGVGTVVLNNNI